MEVGWGDFENLFVIDDDMETPDAVFDVSGRVSSLGFLASSELPLVSPVLFFTDDFLSHC